MCRWYLRNVLVRDLIFMYIVIQYVVGAQAIVVNHDTNLFKKVLLTTTKDVHADTEISGGLAEERPSTRIP
jgi:hypothetical protein